jgi:hypothetical protein
MHSTACRYGYPSDSTQEAGRWCSQRATARRIFVPTPLTDDATSVIAPSCLSSRAGCHPPEPVPVRVGTHLRRSSWPPLLAGPGGTRPDLSMSRSGLGANGGSLPLCWAGGPCATGSYNGRQLGCSLVWWIH